MSRSAVATLPATKFALPHEQPGIIVRPRLLRALDEGVERPLTLISAPPGSGKTSLLGSWVASAGAPDSVAWLSLDSGDGQRRRFWQAVLQALSRAGGGEAVTALAAHPPTRIERLVSALTDALEGHAGPLVLVLDDFHEVGGVVHVDLDQLLHRPPPALRLVIATRSDPPLRLGRLRMQGELGEIRAPELALTLAESAEMLEAVGVSMEDRDVRRLWDHTEGWVGAMRLAALALRDHPDPSSFVADFAGDDRAISDYLLSEVMSVLSAEDRSFLLRTSIAGLLNGDLADALTDRADGHIRLGELSRGGALLAPLDRRGDWYRYHALFRELLVAELRSEAPELIPSLHRRAASWFADHGDEARGLVHAVEAEAWDLAARLAGERWVDLLIRGEVGALEPADRASAGRVGRGGSRAGARGRERAARPRRPCRGRGDARQRRDRRAACAARAPRALHRVRRGAAHAPGPPQRRSRRRGRAGPVAAGEGHLETRSVDAGLRALALVHLGIAELWAGDAEEAEHHLERARGAAAEAGRDWLVLMAVAHLALLAATTSDYARSARLAGDAIALAEAQGWDRTWPAGAAYLALASAEFLWDRSDDAAQTLEHCRAALGATQERPLRAALALVRSVALDRQGELETCAGRPGGRRRGAGRLAADAVDPRPVRRPSRP